VKIPVSWLGTAPLPSSLPCDATCRPGNRQYTAWECNFGKETCLIKVRRGNTLLSSSQAGVSPGLLHPCLSATSNCPSGVRHTSLTDTLRRCCTRHFQEVRSLGSWPLISQKPRVRHDFPVIDRLYMLPPPTYPRPRQLVTANGYPFRHSTFSSCSIHANLAMPPSIVLFPVISSPARGSRSMDPFSRCHTNYKFYTITQEFAWCNS